MLGHISITYEEERNKMPEPNDPNVGDMIRNRIDLAIDVQERNAFFRRIVQEVATEVDFAGGNPYLLENFKPFIENFVFAYQRTVLMDEKRNVKQRLENKYGKLDE
jgi:hypothetical protein